MLRISFLCKPSNSRAVSPCLANVYKKVCSICGRLSRYIKQSILIHEQKNSINIMPLNGIAGKGMDRPHTQNMKLCNPNVLQSLARWFIYVSTHKKESEDESTRT